uniref:MADF domain-containing protein n=1 Tax=Glossina morsitans morsitans TaxID=37546 RepID=A0ABK9MHY4_GLOMM
MSSVIDKEFHDVLSRLLQDYPKLWHHRRGSIKDQYLKLATKLSEKLHRPVSEKKVRTVLKNVRRHLQRLDKGLSQRTHYCAYLWYAEELGYMRATETISQIIEEKEFFEEKVALNGELCASSWNSAASIKIELEEYNYITEESHSE